MKWYTCTPVSFKGDHTFFSRDSGAFCKAFQRIGVESRAIMPTPAQEGDDPDLIRTEYANLKDAAWWKSLGIDGVILYAWGMGKYLPIARAIHDAGIFLVVYMDSSGLFFPWQYWLPIAKNMYTKDVFIHGKIKGSVFFLLRLLKQHTWNLASRGRRKHLDQGDMVAFPIPAALQSVADREWLYGKSIVRKLALVPNPISSTCRFAGGKRNIIMAVGRWDDLLYKRPCLLMSTLEQALTHAPHWEAEIYGNIPDFLREWHGNLPEPLRTRIHLAGYIPNIELQKKQSQARISLCTSLSEGTHLASAEALCSGASVVGPRLTPQLNCLQWYVSHDSGTLSPDDFRKASPGHFWKKSAPGTPENATRRKYPAIGVPCCMRKIPANALLPPMKPPKAEKPASNYPTGHAPQSTHPPISCPPAPHREDGSTTGRAWPREKPVPAKSAPTGKGGPARASSAPPAP